MTDEKPTQLLNITPTDNPPEEGNVNANAWYFADDIPGVGDRPEYLDTRYKTVAEQAKAYKELERRFSAIGSAPDDYDLGHFNATKEHPDVQSLLDYAKQNKLSQEGVGKFFETFDKLNPRVNLDEERSKLGPNADEIVSRVETWASNNLSKKALETIGKIGDRAEVVEMLNEIRMKQSASRTQPPHSDEMYAPKPPATLKELQNEMIQNAGDGGKWHSDPNYRTDLRRRMEEAEEFYNRQ